MRWRRSNVPIHPANRDALRREKDRPCDQLGFDVGQDAFVPDPTPHPIHEAAIRNLVETGFDVTLDDRLVGAGREVAYLCHRVLSPARRAEPVAVETLRARK